MTLNKRSFFVDVFGFPEGGYEETREKLLKAYSPESQEFIFENGRSIGVGKFSTPTLSESRAELKKLIDDCLRTKIENNSKGVSEENITGDIANLHKTLPGVFMVASQFNTLEHANPTLGPDEGTTNYKNDNTEGTACAMSAGGPLLFRNFVVRFKNGIVSTEADAQIGQTNNNQINCFSTVQDLIIKKAQELKIVSPGRRTHKHSTYFSIKIPQDDNIPQYDFFAFQNGYIESTTENLKALNTLLERGGEDFKQQLKDALRVGIHRDAQVTTVTDKKKLVTQVLASAIGIKYSNLSGYETEEERKELWKPLAKIVLEGAYEHTLLEGLKNNAKKILTGQPTEPILLTKLGGGAFGNDPQWIKDAMASAIEKAGNYGVPFDVQLVHYGKIDPRYNDGFLERAVENANSVMTSSTPAMASPASAPVPDLMEPVSIAKDPIVEGNIKLLTEDIKLSIQNVKVEHEKKGAENQYRLIFQNAEDTTSAYGLLSRRYDIIPEPKEKEKDGDFVIVLNDGDVKQFEESIASKKQSPGVSAASSFGAGGVSASGGIAAAAVTASLSFGGSRVERSAFADADAAFDDSSVPARPVFLEPVAGFGGRLPPDDVVYASGAGAGADAGAATATASASFSFGGPQSGGISGNSFAGNRPAGAGAGADAGASATASFSVRREHGLGAMSARMDMPPSNPVQPPSPEVKTSNCFSCFRALVTKNDEGQSNH